MGLVNRIRRITLDRIDGLLHSLEDPDTLFPQLVRELQAERKTALQAESKASSAFSAQQKRVDTLKGTNLRLESAIASMQQPDADALKAQCKRNLDELQIEITTQENRLREAYEAYQSTAAAYQELDSVIERMEENREIILERARAGKPIREIVELAEQPPGKGQLTGLLDLVGRVMNLPIPELRRPAGSRSDTPLDVQIYQRHHQPVGEP